MIKPQECLFSTASAYFAPDCFPTTVAHPYSHLSKVFNHPLNEKGLKINKTLPSQHFSYIEVLLLTAESAVLFSKKQHGHNAIANAQSVSYAQSTSSPKIYENSSEAKNVKDQ